MNLQLVIEQKLTAGKFLQTRNFPISSLFFFLLRIFERSFLSLETIKQSEEFFIN